MVTLIAKPNNTLQTRLPAAVPQPLFLVQAVACAVTELSVHYQQRYFSLFFLSLRQVTFLPEGVLRNNSLWGEGTSKRLGEKT
jgi:hypothetical protein